MQFKSFFDVTYSKIYRVFGEEFFFSWKLKNSSQLKNTDVSKFLRFDSTFNGVQIDNPSR